MPTLTAYIDNRVKADSHAEFVAPQRLAEIAGIAGRKTFGSTCLHRSLALLVLLRRQGTAVRLAIGVNHEAGFDAHAWVEVEASEPMKLHGHPADGRYTRLLEYEL